MEKLQCEIAISVFKSGGVKVEFKDGHVRKRELLKIIRLLKQQHRENIKEYRRKLRMPATVLESNGNVIVIKEN